MMMIKRGYGQTEGWGEGGLSKEVVFKLSHREKEAASISLC